MAAMVAESGSGALRGVIDSKSDGLLAADDNEGFWTEFSETAVDVKIWEPSELWETFPCVDWLAAGDGDAESVPLEPTAEPLSESADIAEPAEVIESIAAQRVKEEGSEGAATFPTRRSSVARRTPLTRLNLT